MRLAQGARAAVESLRDGLTEAVGGDLVSIVVHGSAVRGDWDEAHSDIDVIVVLRDTSLARLEACAQPLQLGRHRSRIEVMILKDGEVARAADVFPVFYADIRGCHEVVHGSDPFADIEIRDEHLRLRAEQELREVKIRMRRAAVDALGDERLLAAALRRKVKQVRSPLLAVMRLAGAPPADDGLATVWRAAGARYGVDVAPLLVDPLDPRWAHPVFRQVIEAAIDEVDRLDGASAAPGGSGEAR